MARMKYVLLPLIVSSVLTLSACTDKIEHCTNSSTLEIQCGFPQVEDMAAIPNTELVIFSEYGSGGKSAGKISLYSIKSQASSPLFDSNSKQAPQSENWGDTQCEWPALLSPHGIHLSNRLQDNGKEATQLLVVNHGQQEQVLFFELKPNAQSSFDLTARGCVTFPPLAMLNDIVALDNGDFATTQMFQANQKMVSQFKALLNYDTGFVYHWSKHNGLTALDGSDGALPNGIETNVKKDLLFVNMYFNDAVKIYSLKQHTYIKSIDIKAPDNSSWSHTGELLIASHQTSFLETLNCFDMEESGCGGAFDIIALNTHNGETRKVYSNAGGEAFGPASIAIEFKESNKVKLLMGSFSGNRIARTRDAVK